MNISKYMKEHELYIKRQLALNENNRNMENLKAKHERIIKYMQHERLIHLLVTLSFGVFLLITMAVVFIKPNPKVIILMGLFLIMLIPYIAHYFFMENTIQRWYKLSDEIEEKQLTFKE